MSTYFSISISISLSLSLCICAYIYIYIYIYIGQGRVCLYYIMLKISILRMLNSLLRSCPRSPWWSRACPWPRTPRSTPFGTANNNSNNDNSHTTTTTTNNNNNNNDNRTASLIEMEPEESRGFPSTPNTVPGKF